MEVEYVLESMCKHILFLIWASGFIYMLQIITTFIEWVNIGFAAETYLFPGCWRPEC